MVTITAQRSPAILSAGRYYEAIRGNRPWPSRGDVRMEDLRAACSHAFFLRVGRFPPTETDLKFVNTGTALRKVLGVELTGMTCADLRLLYERDGQLDHCIHEYVDCAANGEILYNESQVVEPDGRLIRYDRILFPLGEDPRTQGAGSTGVSHPDHILGFVDFHAHGHAMAPIAYEPSIAVSTLS